MLKALQFLLLGAKHNAMQYDDDLNIWEMDK